MLREPLVALGWGGGKEAEWGRALCSLEYTPEVWGGVEVVEGGGGEGGNFLSLLEFRESTAAGLPGRLAGLSTSPT